MHDSPQQSVTEQDRPEQQDSARTLVVEEIWNIFATCLEGIAAADSIGAGFQLREMLAALDVRFRILRQAQPDGIHDTVTIQLHGVLSERLTSFIEQPQSRDAEAATRWLVGAINVYHELAQLSAAFETVTADGSEAKSDRQFSFAGKSTFIPISQVVQLLGGSRHRGVLTLESAENCLDVYFDDSCVAFFNPRNLLRRVFVGTDLQQFKEIPREALTRAERHHLDTGKPLVISLAEQNILAEQEVCEVGYVVGSEVFFALIHDPEEVRFRYSRLRKLPGFVNDLRIDTPITPLLLESNKQYDDWLALAKVFPDPTRGIERTEDALKMVADMQLGAHELRILMAIDGKVSIRNLIDITGLPSLDVYQILVRYALDEVVLPHCAPEQLAEMLLLGLTNRGGSDSRNPQDPSNTPTFDSSDSLGGALDFLDC